MSWSDAFFPHAGDQARGSWFIKIVDRSRRKRARIDLIMIRYLSFLFAVLLGVSGVVAQESRCPSIAVLGPAGIPKPGEGMVFRAQVQGFDGTPGYSWMASTGEIVEGQGTSSIRVKNIDRFKNLTVTLRVAGLPEGCPNTASETATDHCYSNEATVLKEWSGVALAGTDDAIAELKYNPGSTIAVVIEVDRKESIEPLKSRTLKFVKRLSPDERSRIRFVIRKTLRDHTTIYLVPPGAVSPTCQKDEVCLSHPE